MKRSNSLDLFICLWGRALAAQIDSAWHPATSSTGCVGVVVAPKWAAGVSSLCGPNVPPQRKPEACATAEQLSDIIIIAGCAWLGSVPSLDDAVHAASTREKRGHQQFSCMKSRRLDIWQYLPEDRTRNRVQQVREFPGLPAGGLPRFDPCAEYRLLPQQRVQEQRNPSAHGGTGRSHDRIPVTANRFAAATEETAGCKSGLALAAG